MRKKGGSWSFADLDKFIKPPRAFILKTKMPFGCLTGDGERADIIAFLRSLSDMPVLLPAQ